MVRRVLVLTGLLSVLVASPATAASSQATLHVSVRAVASLSFKVIEEPSRFRIRKGKDTDEHERSSKDRSDREDEHERSSKDRSDRDGEHEERRQAGQTSVRGLMVVSVSTNNSNGYALQFQAAKLPVYNSARIEIKGLGAITLRPGESAQIPVRKPGRRDVRTIKVVLKIPSKAKPGSYPWPINVSAIPL